mgnify:CR=1 FL=1
MVGLVAFNFGWRISFVVIAVLGALWLLAWLMIFKDTPDQHASVSQAERELIRAGREEVLVENVEEGRSLFSYIFSVPVLAVATAFFCFNYVLYFFLTWLPSYLMDYQHLDIKSMSIIGVIALAGVVIARYNGDDNAAQTLQALLLEHAHKHSVQLFQTWAGQREPALADWARLLHPPIELPPAHLPG